MGYKSISKKFSISGSLVCLLSAQAFADPAPYPLYQSAVGINPQEQIKLEARWLTQNLTYNNVIPKSYGTKGYWQYLLEYNPAYMAFRNTHELYDCRAMGGNEATIERVLTDNGLDIYDGAVWQIALSIAAQQNTEYGVTVKRYQDFLVNGSPTGFNSYHAFQSGADGSPYLYNGRSFTSANQTYLLKFISAYYGANTDSINHCTMNWPEWNAVTGEEAWAVLIGPVQSLYNLNNGKQNKNWSTVGQNAADFIDLGKNALGAMQAMQDSATGGVYRDVTQPHTLMNKNISLENDFSLYAGLTLLKKALLDRQSQHSDQLNKLAKGTEAFNQVSTLVSGDQKALMQIDSLQQGLIKFFTGRGGVKVYDMSNGYFYSSVDTNNLGATSSTPFAVDVQTWGATIIATNPELLSAVENAYGSDALYRMYQSTIQHSGYYAGNQLQGVGYTTQKAGDEHYVLSGEWTLGAINAAIVLADHYKGDPEKKSALIQSAKAMLQGVTEQASSVAGSDANATLSYLYANKRVFIPFGWYANATPATASTAWSLMINSCYDPFELGGGEHWEVCKEMGIG